MSIKVNNELLYKIFIFNFYLLALSIAPSEFLKQVSTIILMLIGLSYFVTKNIYLQKDVISYSAIALIIISFISAIFAINFIDGMQGFYDMFRTMILFLIFRSFNLKKTQIDNFLNLLFIATMLTLFNGMYHYFTDEKMILKLKSIGYINDSAIFLLIIFALSFSFLLKNYEKLTLYKKIFLFFITFFTFIGIFMGGSRAAMGTIIITIILILFLTKKISNKKIVYPLIILFIAVAIGIALFDNYTLHKIHKGLYLKDRIIVWVSAWKGWLDHNILLGVGPDNSYNINPQTYFPHTYMTRVAHAHNTFLDALIETGPLGLIFYIVFIFSILIQLVKIFKTNANALVISSLAIWIINFIISFVNLTFHHEDGLLMALIWALALNKNIMNEGKQHNK